MTVITVGDRLRLVRTNYRDSGKTELQRGDQEVITEITELASPISSTPLVTVLGKLLVFATYMHPVFIYWNAVKYGSNRG